MYGPGPVLVGLRYEPLHDCVCAAVSFLMLSLMYGTQGLVTRYTGIYLRQLGQMIYKS